MTNSPKSFIGKIYTKQPVQQINERFSKQMIVVMDDTEKRIQYVPFWAYNQVIEEFTKINSLDLVEIRYKPTGRIWEKDNGKRNYLCALEIIEVERLEKHKPKSLFADKKNIEELPSIDSLMKNRKHE